MEATMMSRRHSVVVVILAVAVLVLAAACTTNYWPTITGLTAQAGWVVPGGSLRVTCSAADPAGTGLTYQWAASGGTVAGVGAVVDWTAPQVVGMYDLTVTVTNAQNRQSTETLALVVSNGPPPVILSLTPAARDHKYLKTIPRGYMAARTFEYDLTCVATAASGEPAYQWSTNGGEISGEGSTVIWTAPDRDGRFTVTVRVSDTEGNWVRQSIEFDVVDCEACVVW
jgi:hypothetical protein